MAFSTPVGLSWDSLPPPTESVRTDGRTDVRMYGRTDGRSRVYYVTTKISRIDRLPNFLSNGAPLAGFARRLRYNYRNQQVLPFEPAFVLVFFFLLFLLLHVFPHDQRSRKGQYLNAEQAFENYRSVIA